MTQKKTLIQICNTEWEIRRVTGDTMRRHYGRTRDQLDGFADFDKQRIYINYELAPYRQGVTLVHELLHVIADAHGDEDMEGQEAYIRRLEHGVYELLTKFPEEYKL